MVQPLPKQEFQLKSKWDVGDGYYVKFTHDILFETTSIIVSPTLHFKLPIGFHYFYSSFGVLFANTKMKEDNNYVLYNNIPGYYPSETTESFMEYDKNNSVGLTAGIGFEYYLGNAFYNIALQFGLKFELEGFSKKEKKEK